MAEPGIEQTEGITPNQRLKKWVETGYDEQKTVALYGTNVEKLLEILSTGKMPSHSPEQWIPYQAAIAAEGKLMYFALPTYKALQRERPELLKAMVGNIGSQVVAEHDLSYDWVRNSATRYAEANAVRSYFFDKTGIWPTGDIWGVFEEVFEAEGEVPDKMKESFDQIQKTLSSKGINLKEIFLQSPRSKKGVIFYLNKDIFSGTEVMPGNEDEEEIVIVSRTQLSVDVISGIEVLSNDDMAELRKHYEI